MVNPKVPIQEHQNKMYEFQRSTSHLVWSFVVSTLYNFILNPASYLTLECIHHWYSLVRYYNYKFSCSTPLPAIWQTTTMVDIRQLYLACGYCCFYIFSYTIFISLVTTALMGLFNIAVLVLALFLLIISVSLFIGVGSFYVNII